MLDPALGRTAIALAGAAWRVQAADGRIGGWNRMNSTSEIVDGCLAALRSGGMKRLHRLAGATEALMASPGAGAEVAGRVGEEAEAEVLLEVALDAARMAREDRQTWGDGFVESVEAWIAERDAAGDLPAAARIGLGRAFTRAGLAAPPGLALKLGEDGLIEGGEDAADGPSASLLDSLTDLRRDLGDDPPSLHQAVRELLALMPPEVRGFLSAASPGRAIRRCSPPRATGCSIPTPTCGARPPRRWSGWRSRGRCLRPRGWR